MAMYTQSLYDFRGPRSDERMPRSRLRNALYRRGFKGNALREELDRITGGPLAIAIKSKDVAVITACLNAQSGPTFPYGWCRADLTRPMRRIFHRMERSKNGYIILDEYQMLMHDYHMLKHGQDNPRAMIAPAAGR